MRERQIEYIENRYGKPSKNLTCLGESELFWMIFNALSNSADVPKMLAERIRDDYRDGVLDDLKDIAYDKIIAGIDWAELSECDQCQAYFEGDDRFCSEDCEEVHADEISRDKR